MKKLLCFLLIFVMTVVPVTASEDAIEVYVNEHKIDFDVKPVIIQGRTMVPLRGIFEALGATVEWNNETRSVISVRDELTVSLSIGSNIITVNSSETKLDVAPQIINDRTLVPVRAVSEAFDCSVIWDNESRCVKIYDIDDINITLNDIPTFEGKAYTVVNNNEPFFNTEDFEAVSFELYSEQDMWQRCGEAVSIIGKDIMPTSERESIANVIPTGWQNTSYAIVEEGFLYQRCHLLGFQLTGENDNPKNLITGTRYLNIEGMLPFENMIAEYVKTTGNHVLYRATPMFSGDNMLSSGVLLEAESMEDNGEGVLFNVFCYNVQPGVIINYASGKSNLDEAFMGIGEATYIINTNSNKFHEVDCGSAKTIKAENREESYLTRETLMALGYTPCGNCEP